MISNVTKAYVLATCGKWSARTFWLNTLNGSGSAGTVATALQSFRTCL